MLTTERLILRPWEEADAKSLYQYAKDPDVGPAAGWPVHTSVENSMEIIKTVLSEPETYAVCLKNDNRAIGSVGLMVGKYSNLEIPDTEAEVGYWIGKPFWGKGYIPEAVFELMRYGFEELKLDKLWCSYFDGNVKSKRVQEKCGFVYKYTRENVYWPPMDVYFTEHVSCISRENWNKR